MEKFEPERIYQLYFDTIYKICFLYMKNHADAQDMTQETFCRMLRHPFRYETDEKAKAWLIVTASNLCKNHLKKWWMKKSVSYEDTMEQSDGRSEKYAEYERDKELYLSVMNLEEKYALPTYLYYYEGYKTAEIAQILNTKQSTIQTRLAKARKILKMELT